MNGTIGQKLPYREGRFYDVPCVRIMWLPKQRKPRWIPITGPRHEDGEFLYFPYQHWHVDHRFLHKSDREKSASLDSSNPRRRDPATTPRVIYNRVALVMQLVPEGQDLTIEQIIHRGLDVREFGITPDHTVFRRDPRWYRVMRRKCSERCPSYDHRPTWLRKLEAVYRDHQLGPARMCPHKGADLSTIEPDEDGQVVCPFHGLLGHENRAAGGACECTQDLGATRQGQPCARQGRR